MSPASDYLSLNKAGFVEAIWGGGTLSSTHAPYACFMHNAALMSDHRESLM